MRLSCVVLLLVAVGAAHAQLNLGPGGIKPPPINLVTVYQYMRNFWSSLMGNSVPEEKSDKESSIGPEKRQSSNGAALSYDSELQNLKARIQQASSSAGAPKMEKGDSDDPALTRAILIPKKKIVLGKWPIVYGVLNSILLAAAIILAKPYFYDGETIVSAYSDEHAGYGYHSPPEEYGHGGYAYGGHSYSDEHKGKFFKGKGKGKGYAKPPRGYPGSIPHVYSSSKGKGPTQAYAVVPASRIPSPAKRPHQTNMYSSHMLVLDPHSQRHKKPSSFKHRSSEYRHHGSPEYVPSNSQVDLGVDAPFNEIHYYNPTVFTASEPSSYACLERMACMNPSRSARARVLSTIEADVKESSSEGEASANWENMIRRLDDAADKGERREDCAQFYCPPPLPEYFENRHGDNYSPPPPPINHVPIYRGHSFENFQQFRFDDSSSTEINFQRLHPVHAEYFPAEPLSLHQLNGVPFSDGVVETANFVPAGLSQAIFIDDSNSFEEGRFIASNEFVKKQSQDAVQYVTAPKISTSVYPKVAVQTPSSETETKSSGPRIIQVERVTRKNRGFKLPLKK